MKSLVLVFFALLYSNLVETLFLLLLIFGYCEIVSMIALYFSAKKSVLLYVYVSIDVEFLLIDRRVPDLLFNYYSEVDY